MFLTLHFFLDIETDMYFDTYINVIRKRIQTTSQVSTTRLKLLITLSRLNPNWILCNQIINTDANTETDTDTLGKSELKLFERTYQYRDRKYYFRVSFLICASLCIRASIWKKNFSFGERTDFTDTFKNLELFLFLPIHVSILILETGIRTHTFMKTKIKNDTYISSNTDINGKKKTNTSTKDFIDTNIVVKTNMNINIKNNSNYMSTSVLILIDVVALIYLTHIIMYVYIYIYIYVNVDVNETILFDQRYSYKTMLRFNMDRLFECFYIWVSESFYYLDWSYWYWRLVSFSHVSIPIDTCMNIMFERIAFLICWYGLILQIRFKNFELFLIHPIHVSILILEADIRTHTFMKTKIKNDTYSFSSTDIKKKNEDKYKRFYWY